MRTDCGQCRARIETLERRMALILEKSGIGLGEVCDIEMAEALDLGAQTLNFSALKDVLTRRNGVQA